jgi:DNA-binding PadR family transcriptional regulator
MSTQPKQRLPRFRRAQGAPELHLTHRDIAEILPVIHMLRLATSEQISALATGSKQQILRRLRKLFDAGLLDRITPRIEYGAGSKPMVYAITNKGLQTLQKEGLIQTIPETDYSYKNQQIGELFIDHRLLISQFQTVVTLACRNHPELRLLGWREGRAIQDSIEVSLPQGFERIPVAADGFFSLGLRERRAHFFLEADRGTMQIKNFTQKLIGFQAWRKAGRHAERFEIKSFRVLTVTSSIERRRNLIADARKWDDVKEDGRRFLFTTEDQLQLDAPGKIFEKIWISVAGDEPCSLL